MSKMVGIIISLMLILLIFLSFEGPSHKVSAATPGYMKAMRTNWKRGKTATIQTKTLGIGYKNAKVKLKTLKKYTYPYDANYDFVKVKIEVNIPKLSKAEAVKVAKKAYSEGVDNPIVTGTNFVVIDGNNGYNLDATGRGYYWMDPSYQVYYTWGNEVGFHIYSAGRGTGAYKVKAGKYGTISGYRKVIYEANIIKHKQYKNIYLGVAGVTDTLDVESVTSDFAYLNADFKNTIMFKKKNKNLSIFYKLS